MEIFLRAFREELVLRIVMMNSVAEDEGRLYNVMTRDFKMVGTTETSSYAVVHQIDGFLVYGGNGGIYNVEKDRFEFLKE